MALYAASSSALAGAAASIDSGAAVGCLSLVFGGGGGCCCAGCPWLPPYCAAAIPAPHSNIVVSATALTQAFNVPFIDFLLVKFPAGVRGLATDRFAANCLPSWALVDACFLKLRSSFMGAPADAAQQTPPAPFAPQAGPVPARRSPPAPLDTPSSPVPLCLRRRRCAPNKCATKIVR